MSHISRRHLIKGSAWTAPVVLAATSVPAYAASTCANITYQHDSVAGHLALNNLNGGEVKSLTVTIGGYVFDTTKIDPTVWTVDVYRTTAVYIGPSTFESINLPMIPTRQLKEQSYTVPVEEINAFGAEWDARFNNKSYNYNVKYRNAKNDPETYLKWINNVSEQGLYCREMSGWIPVTRVEFTDQRDGGIVKGYDDYGKNIVSFWYSSLSSSVIHYSHFYNVTMDPACPRPRQVA